MSTATRTIFIATKRPTRRRILIAGMGTSPAVLTETVWALAHQKKPVVPDEIVVLTTKPGKDALRTSVMSGASWRWRTGSGTARAHTLRRLQGENCEDREFIEVIRH